MIRNIKLFGNCTEKVQPVNLFVECSSRCFLSIPQLSQSSVASVPTCLDHVSGIKFRISIYLKKKINYTGPQ